MQVSPLLTPLNLNTKKRTRSGDDYESNYFKKRLISCLSTILQDISPPPPNSVPQAKNDITKIDDIDQYLLDDDEQENHPINDSDHTRINIININGSMLPLEQRPGESKFRIPSFVLNDYTKQNDNQSLNDPMDLD